MAAGAGRIDYGVGIVVYDHSARGTRSAQRNFMRLNRWIHILSHTVRRFNHQYGITSALFGKVGRFIFAGYAIRAIHSAWTGTMNMIEQSQLRLAQAISSGFSWTMEESLGKSSALFEDFLDDARRQIGDVQDRIDIATFITTPLGLAGMHLQEIRGVTNKLVVASSMLGISYKQVGSYAQRWVLGSAKATNKLVAMMTAYYTKQGVIQEGAKGGLKSVFDTYEKRARALQDFLQQYQEKYFGRTMMAKVETLSDNIRMTIAKASWDMWEMIKNSLDKFNEWWFDASSPDGVITKWMNKFGEGLRNAFAFVHNAVKYIVANWDRILPAIKLAVVFSTIKMALTGIMMILKSPFMAVGLLGALGGFKDVSLSIDKVYVAMQAIIQAIGSGGYVTEKMYNKLKKMGILEGTRKVYGSITDLFDFLKDAGKGFVGMIEPIKAALKELAKTGSGLFGSVLDDGASSGETFGRMLGIITVGIIKLVDVMLELLDVALDFLGLKRMKVPAGGFLEIPSNEEINRLMKLGGEEKKRAKAYKEIMKTHKVVSKDGMRFALSNENMAKSVSKLEAKFGGSRGQFRKQLATPSLMETASVPEVYKELVDDVSDIFDTIVNWPIEKLSGGDLTFRPMQAIDNLLSGIVDAVPDYSSGFINIFKDTLPNAWKQTFGGPFNMFPPMKDPTLFRGMSTFPQQPGSSFGDPTLMETMTMRLQAVMETGSSKIAEKIGDKTITVNIVLKDTIVGTIEAKLSDILSGTATIGEDRVSSF
jgi:hypothetical protein